MADDPGGPIFQGLLDRGFSPVHAAAITGNMQQESGFRPDAINPKEDAHGLIQWRLDRWNALQDFAKTRGTDPTDRDTQLDFIRHEMGGSERRAGDRFMAATDLPSANSALKGYIRYGDDSQGTRLANASRFAGDQPATVAGAPPSLAPAGAPQQQSAPPMTFGSMAPAAPGDAQPQQQAQQQAQSAMQQQSPFDSPAQQQPDAGMGRMAMPLTQQAKARLFAALAGRTA